MRTTHKVSNLLGDRMKIQGIGVQQLPGFVQSGKAHEACAFSLSASSAALLAACASSAALLAICASSAALLAISASSAALLAISASSAALLAICASSAALLAICASSSAFFAVSSLILWASAASTRQKRLTVSWVGKKAQASTIYK